MNLSKWMFAKRPGKKGPTFELLCGHKVEYCNSYFCYIIQ